MLAAEFAELFLFKSVGIVLLVLLSVIVALFALGASQGYFDTRVISHFVGTSIY
jgi:hypothetical protein